jgi:hypothetical protein
VQPSCVQEISDLQMAVRSPCSLCMTFMSNLVQSVKRADRPSLVEMAVLNFGGRAMCWCKHCDLRGSGNRQPVGRAMGDMPLVDTYVFRDG